MLQSTWEKGIEARGVQSKIQNIFLLQLSLSQKCQGRSLGGSQGKNTLKVEEIGKAGAHENCKAVIKSSWEVGVPSPCPSGIQRASYPYLACDPLTDPRLLKVISLLYFSLKMALSPFLIKVIFTGLEIEKITFLKILFLHVSFFPALLRYNDM